MPEHLIFHDCSLRTKEAIRHHWTQRQHRLERLLTNFPADQRHLRIAVREYADRCEAHAVLGLSTGTLVARADSYMRDPRTVLDQVIDRMATEIRRHRQLLRHDAARRRNQRRVVFAA